MWRIPCVKIMQPKAHFKRRTLHVPNLSAEFSLFYCASCARLYDLYKVSVSQLIFMPGPAAVTIKTNYRVSGYLFTLTLFVFGNT